MPRPLDEILGIKKTAATHDLQVGERVKLSRGTAFAEERKGEITSIDEWGRVVVRLDIYPNLEFPFHYSYIERV